MSIDVIFFVTAFILSVLPLILESLTPNSQRTSEKPKWYKPTVIVISLAVLLIGTIKTIKDSSDKSVSDSFLTSSKLNGDTLNTKVDTLKSKILTISKRDSAFQKELLSKFDIKRDEKSNKPIYIGTIDNRHNNYTKIHAAEHVDIH